MKTNTPNNAPAAELPESLRGKKQLADDETFCFGCHPGLPCFTDCCSDINILLAPYDVVRLARRIDMPTDEFLEQHTLMPITKELQLPARMLKMDDEQKRCPFVDQEKGCTVYEDRPWSCRMYPVGMAIPPARAGVKPEQMNFLFEDDFCKGHSEETSFTVDDWRLDQGVTEQEEIEKGFREIVSHPYFIGGRQLDPRRIELFHMACYDLDTFRRFVFDSTFLQRFEVGKDEVEAMRTDDIALLRFGFRWLRYALFGEPIIAVRDDAPTKKARRKR